MSSGLAIPLAAQDPSQNANALPRQHRPQKFRGKTGDEKIPPPSHDHGFETGQHQHPMHGSPGETRRLGCGGVEMQWVVVAGDRRITDERFMLERPKVPRADLIAHLWPVRRRRPLAGFRHEGVSGVRRTIRKTVSRWAQISPCTVETAIFKIRRGGFSAV